MNDRRAKGPGGKGGGKWQRGLQMEGGKGEREALESRWNIIVHHALTEYARPT